ncbi:MAG TPA: amidohydrolase family protein [Anaeromyxobacteraceae bacterium]
MPSRLASSFAAVLCACAAATPHPGTASQVKALVGATLVDGTGAALVADAAVIVRGDRIDCAGTRAACPVPNGAEISDLHGSWLTPGLVDAHVHFSQTGWADGRPDALDARDRHPYEQVEAGLRVHPERFFLSYLCSGVTSVFDVGGFPWTFDLPRRADLDPLAPHVVAAGPLLSTLDHWLNLPAERQFVYLRDEKSARESVRYLVAEHAGAAKVWFVVHEGRPFDEMAAAVGAVGDEARKAGLQLIVHATGLREAKEALRAGARLLVHSVEDAPVDDEFLSLAKSRGALYCPTLTVRDGYVRMFRGVLDGRAPAIDDPGGCVDATTRALVAETAAVGAARVDRKRFESRGERWAAESRTARQNLPRVRAAGIPIVMGTDAGNPLTLHGPSVYTEMEAMQAAGLTPMQVIVASTRNGADAMGRLVDLGTVERGKIADLLVLGADPTRDVAAFRVLRAIVRGGVVHEAADLRAAP